METYFGKSTAHKIEKFAQPLSPGWIIINQARFSKPMILATVMIIGLGIDLVPNSRAERELARGEWLLGDGIFTSREISRCSRDRRPALCYAACFAAKEATLKALGVELADLGMMREVEVELGDRCTIVLHERMKSESEYLGVRHIRLSIASSKRQTGAMVILES